MKRSTMKGVSGAVLAGALLMSQAGVAHSLPILVSRDLGANHYSAKSSSAPVATYGPDKAFDDPLPHPATRWLAGENATWSDRALNPQWIQADLGQEYHLTSLSLELFSSLSSVTYPNGVAATFNVYASDAPIQGTTAAATLIETFTTAGAGTGFHDKQLFTSTLPHDLTLRNFRYVEVQTTMEYRFGAAATAYVRPGWRNIEVYALDPTTVPEPSTLLLLGAGMCGVVTLGRKRRKR